VADEALARGERQPLLEIPMTVKEQYNVAGLPTTWGISAFKGWQPTEDSVVVARLKAAGAVILGKTNVPTALGDWQSFNDIYGTTNNPWDLTRTSGGSTGGAAGLAAGYVSLEMDSDLGGSIRVPAHFCGVCGHKPSRTLIPGRGTQFPKDQLPSFLDLAVLGPVARTPGDLSMVLDVVAGPDESEATAYRLALPPARHDNLKSFRILVIDTHPLVPTSNTLRASLNRLSDQLTKAGANVAHGSPSLPDLAEQARVYSRLVLGVVSAKLAG
jgi:amidase